MQNGKHSILVSGEIVRINSVEKGIANATLRILPDDFMSLAYPDKIGQLVEGYIDSQAIPLKIGKVIPQEILIDEQLTSNKL